MRNKFLLAVLALAMSFVLSGHAALAATPTLSLSSTGDGDNVQISVSGDPNTSVLLYYNKADGSSHLQYLSTTNSSGYYNSTVSTATYGISPDSSVHVSVGGKQSLPVAWPYNTTTSGGAITLNQTGLIITVGQSANLTVSNAGSNSLYLLSNSNPQIANVNISNNQLTVLGNAYGQTVLTVCALGTTSNCASAYVTVQNSGAQPLTFTQTNLTVAYGQSSTVTILNGSGSYTILNNSNPSVVTATLDNTVITLRANNTSGKAAITVCTMNMSSCGIINATAGNTSSSSITFSQTSPSLTMGQSLNIALSGGSNFSLSSNSNSNVVSANITGNNTLTLIGNNTGSSVVTVCSSAGNCGSVTATVSYTTSGPISLSQSNLWLQVGQAVSITVSGGSFPYSLANDASNANIFQANLNNNILTLTGTAAGSGMLNVCSAGGACTALSILVNGVTTSTQLTFSNNNLTMNVGGSTDVTLFGNGGFYISNSNYQNIATFTLSNNKVTVKALAAGNANATICQNGGQCGVIYATVNSITNSSSPLTLSQSNSTVSIGQSSIISLIGGASTNYYLSSNTNPTVAQVNLSGSNLVVVGKAAGSTVVNVCAAANSCASLSVTVINQSSPSVPTAGTPSTPSTPSVPTTGTTAKPTTPKPIYKFARYLSVGSVGSDVRALQTRLAWEKVYSGPITGTFGAQTYAGVMAYQKKYGITQLGIVGPATRTALNK